MTEETQRPTLTDVWVYTNAPEAYDYGYCIRVTSSYRLKRSYGPADQLFCVCMPADSENYQTARYHSGNYVAGRWEDLERQFGDYLERWAT